MATVCAAYGCFSKDNSSRKTHKVGDSPQPQHEHEADKGPATSYVTFSQPLSLPLLQPPPNIHAIIHSSNHDSNYLITPGTPPHRTRGSTRPAVKVELHRRGDFGPRSVSEVFLPIGIVFLTLQNKTLKK